MTFSHLSGLTYSRFPECLNYVGHYSFPLDYSISKGGMMTLSRNLADALGSKHIRVNHFNVGWVLSANEQALQESEGQPADWAQHVPFPSGRLLLPDEIARFAVMFVEDAGGPVSGAVMDLNQHGRRR